MVARMPTPDKRIITDAGEAVPSPLPGPDPVSRRARYPTGVPRDTKNMHHPLARNLFALIDTGCIRPF